MPIKPWTVLESQYVLKRWWMNLRQDRVRLPNGTEIPEFHVIEYPHWAAVLCFTEDGQVVMTEQYRHGTELVSLELPAGGLDAEEAPEAAARRELLEETGYAADRWTYLGRCAPEPTKHSNYAYFFIAHGARKVQAPALDASEDVHVRLMTPEAVLTAADNGDITHGTHLTALFWAQYRGFFGPNPPSADE